MACKLYKAEDSQFIPMKDLEYGQLAVIVDDDACVSQWKGCIVTPCHRDNRTWFFAIGVRIGGTFAPGVTHSVRILQPGELIEVE